MPDLWLPDQRDIEHASQAGFPHEKIQRMASVFADYHRAKATLSADWKRLGGPGAATKSSSTESEVVTDLATIEPIMLPDPLRPGILPSLPGWAEHLSGAVQPELQITRDGRSFKDELVLLSNQMPTTVQRRMMISYLDSLGSMLRDTPAANADAETRVATTVLDLLSLLSSVRKSDRGKEARAAAYLDVLNHVAWWAVDLAAHAWLMHECGSDERGRHMTTIGRRAQGRCVKSR